MSVAPRPGYGPPRPRRRRRVLAWIGVACLAAVVIEVGATTDLFGLGGLLKSSGTTSGSPGPNPNPYNEIVYSVLGAIDYTDGNRTLLGLEGAELCSRCPAVPLVNENYSPPVAGVWFYFNITNDGSNWTTLSHFQVSTSGSDPELFVLVAVVCCYPGYSENVTLSGPGFSPATEGSQPTGLAGYAIALSIPYDGAAGYNITFSATSP
jgi:hypothetical protein